MPQKYGFGFFSHSVASCPTLSENESYAITKKRIPTIYQNPFYYKVLREPDKAAVWFQGRNGCFEVPELGKNPQKVVIPGLEVKALSSRLIV